MSSIATRSLTTKELVSLLPEIRRELTVAQRRAQKALAEVESLRKVVAGLEGLANGAAPDNPEPTLFLDTSMVQPFVEQNEDPGPRGQAAITAILREDPARVWATPELLREIQKRGWIDPDARNPMAAVRVAGRRLVDAEVAAKVGPGRYRLRTKPDLSKLATDDPESG